MGQMVFKRSKILLVILMLFCVVSAKAEKDYWNLNNSNGITWKYDGRAHCDHIEMSGKRMSVVLQYGIRQDGSFACNFGMVWPLLRTIPNDTHGSLQRHLYWNALDAVTINQHSLSCEKTQSVTLDGMMTVESSFGQIHVRRVYTPSTEKPALVEKFTLRNDGKKPCKLEIDNRHPVLITAKKEGVYGAYRIEQQIQGSGVYQLLPGDSVSFSALLSAVRENEPSLRWDVDEEIRQRRSLVSQLMATLILKTPDPIINRMFDFSKIRSCESIFQTKAGPMHSPGGEAYYAAIWANDEAEYADPFFPFTGYSYAMQSVMTSFSLFAKYMNLDWKPIPSSIIAEGDDYWNGAGDRGDAAMIAYGASRCALEFGKENTAKQLWPLIKWCLEYCHRKLNADGVVTSDADELEHRFPSGSANLCTSCLYYDALISSSYLARDLNEKELERTYSHRAKIMERNIDNYFHENIEGYDTYRYYKGNKVLRSWICIPLAMGINKRAKGTIDALFSTRLWTENGLLTQEGDHTFWDRSTLYALRGVFMAGETGRAMKFLSFYSHKRLLGDHVPYAIEAWPEGGQRQLSAESALYARVIIEGMFGIRPVGLHSFTVSPRLPKEWNGMSLRHIHICNSDFDLRVVRLGNHPKVQLERNGKIISSQKGKDTYYFNLNN